MLLFQDVNKEITMLCEKLIKISLVYIALMAINSYGNTFDIWWSSQPLDNGSIYEQQKPSKAVDNISLKAPQNYVVYAALMIRNNSETLLTVTPSLANKALLNNIILHDTASIRSRGKILFADILPTLSSNDLLFIPAKETRQLFFEINTKGLHSGLYNSPVHLSNMDSSIAASANIQLEITNLKLPQKPTMDMLVWDCSLRLIKDHEYAEKLAKVLGEAGIDTFHVLETIDIKFNKEGAIVEIPDFSKLDFVLDIIKPYSNFALLRGCRVFVQQGNASSDPNQRKKKLATMPAVDGAIEYNSPAWHNALRHYIKVLSSHMTQKGWTKDEWAFYPYDEYIGVYFSEFAQAVKKIDPEIMIFANSEKAGTKEALSEKVKNEVDLFTPFDQSYYNQKDRELYEEFKPYLKKRWSYFCPWAQLGISPTRKYRIMGWNTFVWGIDGAAYWSATGLDGIHFSGDPWDDTDGKNSNETTLYITDGNVIQSRRWMGVKAASRDHALFITAQKLAQQWPDSHPNKIPLLKLLNKDIPVEITKTRPDIMMDYLQQIIDLTSMEKE